MTSIREHKIDLIIISQISIPMPSSALNHVSIIFFIIFKLVKLRIFVFVSTELFGAKLQNLFLKNAERKDSSALFSSKPQSKHTFCQIVKTEIRISTQKPNKIVIKNPRNSISNRKFYSNHWKKSIRIVLIRKIVLTTAVGNPWKVEPQQGLRLRTRSALHTHYTHRTALVWPDK